MENLYDCHVLVVDDVVDNLCLMQIFLETEGYSVDVANSGALALVKVEASPPNLILLDVMMPEMNGFEVTRQLRQNDRSASIPILLITADAEVSREQGRAVGANGLIRKPISLDDLLESVKEFC
jgi:CheY-like chemotaxis protein